MTQGTNRGIKAKPEPDERRLRRSRATGDVVVHNRRVRDACFDGGLNGAEEGTEQYGIPFSDDLVDNCYESDALEDSSPPDELQDQRLMDVAYSYPDALDKEAATSFCNEIADIYGVPTDDRDALVGRMLAAAPSSHGAGESYDREELFSVADSLGDGSFPPEGYSKMVIRQFEGKSLPFGEAQTMVNQLLGGCYRNDPSEAAEYSRLIGERLQGKREQPPATVAKSRVLSVLREYVDLE
ncbi:hypothetical protein KY362_05910 [Candidatus Woesearchaeota archaeon]|nr:hypothetical protein [Candidatus Woesearchaeota archaeon]